MLKSLAPIAFAAATFAFMTSVAFAQGTQSQEDACRPDVFRLCANLIPDVGQIVACLRGNETRLSDACHQVIFGDQAEPSRYVTPARARPERNQ